MHLHRFNCSYCDYESRHFRLVIAHYRYGHALNPGFRVTCGINQCQRSYRNIRRFLDHIKSKHVWFARQHLPGRHLQDEIEVDIGMHNAPPNIIQVIPNQAVNAIPQPNVQIVNKEKTLAQALLTLREVHKVPNTACAFITDITRQFLDVSQVELAVELKESLRNAHVDINRINGFEDILRNPSGYSNACSQLSTQRKLDSYVENNFPFVKPQQHILGVGHNGKQHTYQYVPILESLKVMLSHEDVLAQVQNSHQSRDEKLRDICDGEVYKENPLFNVDEQALQIIFYYDDFGASNPLGNKTKKYKLGAFYFTLGNLKPKHRSKLHITQLVTLCVSSHIQQYGMSQILEPFLRDMQILEDQGVDIVFEGRQFNFRGTLTVLCADNLAAHAVGRFYENFSTVLRLCRVCNATKHNISQHMSEDMFTLRTCQAYDDQARRAERMPDIAPIYGIKGNSCLNVLQYYHVIKGLPADMAHDVLEGTAPDVITNVIKHLVEENVLSLIDLQDDMSTFPYADCDKANKPQLLPTQMGTFRVKLTAAETWCLLRLLPLMISERVPRDNIAWGVLLDLCDIVELMFAPVYSRGDIMYMKERIEGFHEGYHLVFPDQRTKPKRHYMLHYGTLTERFGPLKHCWTLRFEGKHNYFKELIYRTKNKINLCKSLAMRHQYCQALKMADETILDTSMEVIGGSVVPVRLLANNVQVLLMPHLAGAEEVYQANGVSLDGIRYVRGICVILRVTDDYYRFGLIGCVFVVGGIAHLLCVELDTLEYDRHSHAYIVEESDNFCLVNVPNLLDHHPVGRYIKRDIMYVVMKYDVKYE